MAAEISRLEQQLEELRIQRQELSAQKADTDEGEAVVGKEGDGKVGGLEGKLKSETSQTPPKISKAQRKKVCFKNHLIDSKKLQSADLQERRAQQEREREQRIAEGVVSDADNVRLQERERLEAALKPLRLTISDIQPDGNW